MHILLTDVLACPRCGPDFGLVLLADRLEARRVVDGSLGCANCRERYPVRAGTADLRPGVWPAPDAPRTAPDAPRTAPDAPRTAPDPPRPAAEAPLPGAAPSDEDGNAALRLAALLGVTEGPGIVLLAGSSARLAGAVATRLGTVEVVAAQGQPGGADGGVAAGSVSRMVVPERLPFGTKTLRGVAMAGATAAALLEEGARVLAPMHRLVLEEAGPDARQRVEALGLEILAEDERTLVAVKRGAPDPPKLHQLV